MKQVVFTKEVIVDRTYIMSMKEFMDHYFREAHQYKNGELDLCVASGTHSGYIVPAITVVLLPEELSLDFNDVVNVKLVLKRHLKEE